jgi:hypothetical protein
MLPTHRPPTHPGEMILLEALTRWDAQRWLTLHSKWDCETR